jgi:hypothetical protein
MIAADDGRKPTPASEHFATDPRAQKEQELALPLSVRIVAIAKCN